jgi:16S rRNA (cytosine1402-N4)-methyltransferase
MTEPGVYHIPVMLQECLEALAIRPDGVYVDGTVGGGGHFLNILKHLQQGGTLVGVDRDPQAIAWVQAQLPASPAKVILAQRRFSQIHEELAANGIPGVDGILLDLGVSSHQIDDASRGFSYMRSAELDMRMNPQDQTSALQILQQTDEQGLSRILGEYGEVENPRRMAHAIKQYMATRPLQTSQDLKACLFEEYGRGLKIKVLAKVFQALRIAVNAELDELKAALANAVQQLRAGGRLAVLSYHSLEDRIVKNFLRDQESGCSCDPSLPVCMCQKVSMLKRVTRKALRPQAAEVERNERARSARLRVAERV